MGKRKRDHFYILKRVTDYPGNENKFMFLRKHCLISAKDFFSNIDNTVEGKSFKGVSNLINLYYRFIRYVNISDLDPFGIMQINIIRGVE